ncbi:MAG TPA: acyl-ACP desaturase [Gemmataceae bacterium]|nr:acyl-ACP desaturase [Gemmataceae bacterium]
MTTRLSPEDPDLRVRFYRLYREFFRKAERKRRWSVDTDIPWDQTNRHLPPEYADVVESFCAVELFLPDYISKALPMIRGNRGWSWFHANWGYEESKHSLALSDWLVRSGHRTEEQMADLESQLSQGEWDLPHDSSTGMLIYAMTQELATWLHYRNLRTKLLERGDLALTTLLQYIAVDERAHHAFYREIVQVFLEIDRKETIEQLRRVLLGFSMPAVHMLAESRQRVAKIKSLGIFDEDMFLHDIYQPILQMLGVAPKELRKFTRKVELAV